jgi:hypothetical protein
MATTYSPITSGYTQSIRQNLIGQGVKDSDIGMNKSTGYVTVGGKDAIKAPKTYNGTSYTTKQGFTNDWNNYQKSLQQPAAQVTQEVAQPTQPTPTYDPYKTNNPYDSQYNDLLKTLMDQAKNPAPVDANAIYNSPQWAAQQAQAQKGAQQSIRSSQESLGGAGFGRSTALGERAQGIQNDANEYLNTQVLPQLMAQESASRQQQFQNQFSTLDALMGQQNVYDNRFNSANNLAIDKGQLMGEYLPPEALQLIDQVYKAKEGYGSAQNPGDRQGFNTSANNARARLATMGIENVDALFGSGVNLQNAQGNRDKAGIKTLGGRAQDLVETQDTRNAEIDEQNRILDNAYKQADVTGVIGAILGKMYGLPANTPTQAAMESNRNYALDKKQVAISQQNANISAGNLGLSREKFAYDQEQDKNKPPEVNLDTDPDFADAVNGVLNDPNALATLNSTAGVLISKFGREGFDALLEYATPKKQSNTELFSQMFGQ